MKVLLVFYKDAKGQVIRILKTGQFIIINSSFKKVDKNVQISKNLNRRVVELSFYLIWSFARMLP